MTFSFKAYVFATFTALSLSSAAAFAAWENKVTDVVRVGTGFGEESIACVDIEGETIVLDLTNEKGRAELSIVLVAKLSSSKILVKMEKGGSLTDGCDQGEIHRKHASLYVL
ncbi:MAG: hypothetical protein JKY93_01565 [Gammaproteobacteria bacterium]|nr:hypothetical protein [Gammaproteobacteria bacterium]